MKRYIRAASANDYESYMNIKIGTVNFGVHYTARHELIIKASISSLRPYDDADYTWAKVEGPRVTFIRDGKILDKMTIADYDPDYDIAKDFDEYLKNTFESIAMEMLHYDADIKPRMVHN